MSRGRAAEHAVFSDSFSLKDENLGTFCCAFHLVLVLVTRAVFLLRANASQASGFITHP